MKIAVSGTHRTGKTTLIEALADVLPSFKVFKEPYQQLAADGHVFAAMPSLEDFELQLERSIESLIESEGNCLFDRCPYDILAYLLSHEDSKAFQIDKWLPRVEEAVQLLDLIVFVPIEEQDGIVELNPDQDDLRQRVDEELTEIVLGDSWNFGVRVFEVGGTVEERIRRVFMDMIDMHSVYRI